MLWFQVLSESIINLQRDTFQAIAHRRQVLGSGEGQMCFIMSCLLLVTNSIQTLKYSNYYFPKFQYTEIY